jgi:hypothetical protein
MDEALAAQTSIALYPPNSGFSYTRFSFCFFFAVHGTEMAKLGPQCFSVNHK